MTDSRPVIHDVAELAGVSVATVSRALRGLPNVAPETRARVVAAAAELRYVASPGAARLATGRTMTIGLLVPFFDAWYSSQILAGVEDVLAPSGYDLLISSFASPEGRDRLVAGARGLARRVDGVIMIDLFASPNELDALTEIDVPVASIGERFEPFSSFTIDNHSAAAMATRLLLEQGHRRIGVLSSAQPVEESPVPSSRIAGHRRALAEAGIGIDDSLEVDGEFTTDGGMRGVMPLLRRDDPPTALFCFSDEMAFGALVAAARIDLDVPGELSVMGFDDHDLAEAFGLSTIRQPFRAMGQRAAELVVDQIASETPSPVHETVDVELIQRRSTAPVP